MTQAATRNFVFVIVAMATIATIAVAILAPGIDKNSIQVAGLFGLLGVLAHALAYQRPTSGGANISFIPFLSAVGIAPTLVVVVAVAMAVIVAEMLQRRELIKGVFNVAQYTLSVALAVLVYHLLGGFPIGSSTEHPVLPFVAAFATYVVTNTMTVSGVVAVNKKKQFLKVWVVGISGSILYDVLAIPAVYGFAYVYHFGALWAVGVAFPIFGLRQLYKTNWDLERVNEELLHVMVAAIEARDPYTSGHSQRVSEYAQLVARAVGVGGRATSRIAVAALLHDVGKIHEEFAPILRKPGRLTDEEFAVMRTHSEKGAVLAGRVTQFADVVPAIRSHHEAWDGSGYPDNLRAEEIPLWARIIAFADTIDAMTTDRPYREAMEPDTVRAELRAESGTQFDPDIATSLTSDRNWQLMADAIGRLRPTVRLAPVSRSPVSLQIEARRSAVGAP